jgi:hypothetical protein
MMDLALFGISALMSLVSASALATLIWPHLRSMNREQALLLLVTPHLFLRFIGLSFLVPGVVAASLPAAFAAPAAYGDLGAGILAVVTVLALAKHRSWAIPIVWLFNLWGAADLVIAIYQGQHLHIVPATLGAAFYIPTAIVPPLLVTHALIFGLLLRQPSFASVE